MAWNRPSEGAAKPAPKKPSAMRGIVAGLVVVAVAGACVFIFMGKDEKPVEKVEKKPVRIKEVTPSPAPTNAAPKQTASVQKKTGVGSRKAYQDGSAQFHRKVDYGVIITNAIDETKIPVEERVFKYPATQKIASLLLTEPGTEFIGDVGDMYYKFDERFVESLEEDMSIKADDTDEVKALKTSVAELQKEMKKRKDAGESLEEVMKASWQELKELGLYKVDLEKEVQKILRSDSDITADEIDIYIAAANKMLEGRGLKNLTLPEMEKQRILYKAAKKRSKDNRQ